MDIRSFFGGGGAAKKKRKSEEPVTINSDSEDDFVPGKGKGKASAPSKKKTDKKTAALKEKKKPKTEPKPPAKLKTTPSAFFENTEIRRSPRKTAASPKKKTKKDVEVLISSDSEADVDEEALAEALFGDGGNDEPNNEIKKAKSSPNKTKTATMTVDTDAMTATINSPKPTPKKKQNGKTAKPATPKSAKKSKAAKLAQKHKGDEDIPESPSKKAKPSPESARSPAGKKGKASNKHAADDDDDDGGGDEGKKPKGASPKKQKISPKTKTFKEAQEAGESAAPNPVEGKSTTTAEKDANTEKPARKFNYYRDVQARGAMKPANLGSKELPVGKSNCLFGLKFVVTGVLDSIERETAEELIKKYSGHVAKTVGKTLNYLVAGEEPGPSKMQKAKDMNIKIIDEDGLFELVSTLPSKVVTVKKSKSKSKVKVDVAGQDKKPSSSSSSSSAAVTSAKSTAKSSSTSSASAASGAKVDPNASMLWVDKYKPQSVKNVVGQQGKESNLNKLMRWLDNWHADLHKANANPKYSFNRGAFLHGGPGIGKTTSAKLAATQCGYEAIELNASDTRSKSSLKKHVEQLLNNTTMTQFFRRSDDTKFNKKMVVIMDEVDGMSSNDRGGMAALITLIKTTKIPIICIANDVQKAKSLKNYCLDLSFRKLQTKQIVGFARTVAFREKIKVDAETLTTIVENANCDIRQVLHNLYLWSRGCTDLSNKKTTDASAASRKDIPKGLWDFMPSFWNPQRKLSFNEHINNFFNDYRAAPMFMQENYLKVSPAQSKNQLETLQRVSQAADDIAQGDIVEGGIWANMDFKALPVLATFSCILPGYHMSGYNRGRLEFPRWFGQNSKRGKLNRYLTDIQNHMRMDTSADTREMRMSYVPVLKQRLSNPLVEKELEGVTDVIEVMDAYHLSRADWEAIHELSQFKDAYDPLKKITTKTKSSFTRAWNQSAHHLPYSLDADAAKRKKKVVAAEPSFFDDEEAVEEEEEDDDAGVAAALQKKSKKGKATKKSTGTKTKAKGKRTKK